MQEAFDIFIIGGGINGAGIAADAAGRGLTVALCEKNDLASATSSASSKLIHGGLRYLEQYDFGLVRAALQEREILHRNARHIVSPLEFVLPHDKHLRPTWLIRLGLFIYDHLARHPFLPNSKRLSLTKDPRGQALDNRFTTGFSYYDCHTDDARLVILNAIAAYDHGASILTHTEYLSAERMKDQWKISLKNRRNGETYTVFAKCLINASGPWVTKNSSTIVGSALQASRLVKGSHIVVPRLYEGEYAYILQTKDKRVVFAIPYQENFTLIGTTDVTYTDDLEHVTISGEEKIYLCNTINNYFKKSISVADIIWSYAGIRCLQADNAERPSEVTRDYQFHLQPDNQLLTIISGKLTTYRRLAEEAVNSLSESFPHMKTAWTAQKPLPGGDFSEATFQLFYKNLQKKYSWLPQTVAYRYARSYGTRVELILSRATKLTDLGEFFGAGLYQKEVEYLINHEWAISCEDILWRRSKLGLFLSVEEVEKLQNWLEI